MEALRQVAGNLGPLALGMGFLAGLAFSFNPVALAAIPVSLAYITRSRSANDAIQLGAMFGTGMILAHVVIGFGAGLGGRSIVAIIGTWWAWRSACPHRAGAALAGLAAPPDAADCAARKATGWPARRDAVRSGLLHCGLSRLHAGADRPHRRRRSIRFASPRCSAALGVRPGSLGAGRRWCVGRWLDQAASGVRCLPAEFRDRRRRFPGRFWALHAQLILLLAAHACELV